MEKKKLYSFEKYFVNSFYIVSTWRFHEILVKHLSASERGNHSNLLTRIFCKISVKTSLYLLSQKIDFTNFLLRTNVPYMLNAGYRYLNYDLKISMLTFSRKNWTNFSQRIDFTKDCESTYPVYDSFFSVRFDKIPLPCNLTKFSWASNNQCAMLFLKRPLLSHFISTSQARSFT